MYEYFLYHVNVDVNLPNNSVMLIYAFDNILNKIRKPMFNQHLLRYHEFCNSNMNTYIYRTSVYFCDDHFTFTSLILVTN